MTQYRSAPIHDITLWDLQFSRVPIGALSKRGVPYERWIRVGMPYIPQDLINGTFYLYRTREHAEAGKQPAGSGFLVRYDGPPGSSGYLQKNVEFYAVTNWHVACAEGASIIRLNTLDEGTDIIEFGPEEWCFDPGKHDIAIVPIKLDPEKHSVSAVSTRLFYQPNPRLGTSRLVGVGDDVFMIGLFVDHDGFTTNVPSARFGNISMLTNDRATIRQPTGFYGESFVVDMHSRTGFSGSPVYVYRTFGSNLDASPFGSQVEVSGVRQRGGGDKFSGRVNLRPTMFYLLGIHWGQFPERWELKDKKRLGEADKNLITDGAYVEGLSGMTCVIPAWEIWNILELPELKDRRDSAHSATPDDFAPRAEV